MCEKKQNIWIPQSKNHKNDTSCNNICRHKRKSAICCPTCWIFNITNFQNFQIVYTSNQTISQCSKNKSIKSFSYSFPKNRCFPQKSIHWRLTRQTDHKNCPSHCNSCGTLIQTFQIPKKLRPRKFLKRRSHNFIHNQTPNTKIHSHVKNHVSPKNSNTDMKRTHHFRILKLSIKGESFQIHTFLNTQRQKKLSHMSNTTVCKQSFQMSLRLWCNCSNNHRKSSKKSQSTSKISRPNSLPMMSPKSKNRNFRLHSNPKRYRRPSSLINIRDPKMKGSCCQFPKQTSAYQPNPQCQKQRRFASCSVYLIFKMRKISLSCLPIDKTNSLKQQTTSKRTLLKVFYSSFQRISTFRIQSTKNNQRKTLQFYTQIKRHLICCLNLQILTNLSQHCKINILSMTNRCNFLPTKCNSQNKSTCSLQNNAQLKRITVFQKCSTLNNSMQRIRNQDKTRKQTPQNCPQSQRRHCMIGASCWSKIFFFSVFKIQKRMSFFFETRNNKYFRNRQNKIPCSITKQNKKTKKQVKFWPENNQIQSHFSKEKKEKKFYFLIQYLPKAIFLFLFSNKNQQILSFYIANTTGDQSLSLSTKAFLPNHHK